MTRYKHPPIYQQVCNQRDDVNGVKVYRYDVNSEPLKLARRIQSAEYREGVDFRRVNLNHAEYLGMMYGITRHSPDL